MVLRVRLRVKSGSGEVELVVLANGGAESDEPLLVVDESTAERLGLWPSEEAELYEVEEATTTSRAYVISDPVELELLDGEETLSKITAHLAVGEGLSEPLITDVTIDALGIQIISFGKGLWRHASDTPSKIRRGMPRYSTIY